MLTRSNIWFHYFCVISCVCVCMTGKGEFTHARTNTFWLCMNGKIEVPPKCTIPKAVAHFMTADLTNKLAIKYHAITNTKSNFLSFGLYEKKNAISN